MANKGTKRYFITIPTAINMHGICNSFNEEGETENCTFSSEEKTVDRGLALYGLKLLIRNAEFLQSNIDTKQLST